MRQSESRPPRGYWAEVIRSGTQGTGFTLQLGWDTELPAISSLLPLPQSRVLLVGGKQVAVLAAAMHHAGNINGRLIEQTAKVRLPYDLRLWTFQGL
jgi:hypothetical protein